MDRFQVGGDLAIVAIVLGDQFMPIGIYVLLHWYNKLWRRIEIRSLGSNKSWLHLRLE